VASSNSDKNPLIYEDEHCVIFCDRSPKAFGHLQCVPKRHIKDWTYLKPLESDISLLEHMYNVGREFLIKNYPSPDNQYRLGFHSPGHNSQFHLHMHLISFPLSLPRHEKRYSGEGLTKVDQVLSELIRKFKEESL